MTERFRQMILSPVQADFNLESADLVTILSELGLIGDVLTGASTDISSTDSLRFYVGPHFLQHISFMGCAPAIEFHPPSNKNQQQAIDSWDTFTFIHLPEMKEHFVWYADLQMAKPSCPACDKRISNPEVNLDSTNMILRCPHCGHSAAVCDFNWREFGGCAQILVSIVNVYPKEAIPSSNLLNQLMQKTEVEWRYFYINAPLP